MFEGYHIDEQGSAADPRESAEQKALDLHHENRQLKAEKKLLELEIHEMHRTVVEIAKFPEQNPSPVIRISEKGKILFFNLPGKKILKELRQESMSQQKLIFFEFIKQVLKHNETTTEVFELAHRYFRVTFVPIKENKYVNIFGHEITKQIEAEEVIKRSEQMFRQLVEGANDIIYQTELQGHFNYVNPVAVEITEYSSEELLTMCFTDIIHPDYLEKLTRFYSRQVRKRIPTTYKEFPIVTKSGKTIWLGQKVSIILEHDFVVGTISHARDITVRKTGEYVLKNNEEKYRSILENMELGLLEVDLENRISRAYPKFCELSGYTERELKGQEPEKFLLHENSVAIMQQQEKYRKKGEGSVYEVQLKCKDGSYKWVVISGAPYYGVDGKHLGSVGIHLDITERKNLEQELQEANKVANASSKAKELFLANMSHEIRTPLNAVIGVTQLMAQSDLDESQRNYVQTISKSADNLLMLVNNILDISKIEAEQIELENIPFNLKANMEDVVSSLSYLAKEKGLSLKLITNDLLEEMYFGDPLRLSQIIINLTNNAIKFTEKGSVQIVIEAKKKEDGRQAIDFKLIDTGIGIDELAQETIFEGFNQATQGTSRKYGGTGLGLSICKDLVELFGSELYVHSSLGKGSTFSFTLHLEVCSDSQTESNEIAEVVDWNKLTILIAEDNEVNQFVAVNLIENWGAKTMIANNGLEAIQKLQDHPEIDIVLMDMQMPEMDGVMATKEIRSKLKNSVPIIALTANAIKGDEDKCIAAGMNGYMSKPFKQGVLQKVISQLLDESYRAEIHEEEEAVLVLERIEEMADGNEAFKIKMLKIFLEEGYLQLKFFEEVSDVGEISKTAHKMKPSIDYLATKEMSDLVRKIESKDFVGDPSILQSYIEKLARLLQEIELELAS